MIESEPTATRTSQDPSLDVDFYRSSYLDLANFTDQELIEHWEAFGRVEGRAPNASSVAKTWEEASALGIDPLAYWLACPQLGEDASNAVARALAYWHGEGRWLDDEGVSQFPTEISVPPGLADALHSFRESFGAEALGPFARLLTVESMEVMANFDKELTSRELSQTLLRILRCVSPILCEPAVVEKFMVEVERIGALGALVKSAEVARDHQSKMYSIGELERSWWLLGSPGQRFLESAWRDGEQGGTTDLALREDEWPDREHVKELLARAGFQETGGEPVVSVIVSLYRGAKWIRPFMDSMANQTVAPLMELVVIDAASPDGEAAVISEYADSFGRLIYERAETRIPIYSAWNRAVELSSAPFLTNANLDDFRNDRSVELQLYCAVQTTADIIYQDFLVSFDGPDQVTFIDVRERGFLDVLPPVSARSLMRFNYIHNSPMWRRDLHLRYGLFDEEFRSAGDWEFWVRSVLKGATAFKSPYVTTAYFNNPSGLSTDSGSQLGLREGAQVRNRYAEQALSFDQAARSHSSKPHSEHDGSWRPARDQTMQLAQYLLGVLWQRQFTTGWSR